MVIWNEKRFYEFDDEQDVYADESNIQATQVFNCTYCHKEALTEVWVSLMLTLTTSFVITVLLVKSVVGLGKKKS